MEYEAHTTIEDDEDEFMCVPLDEIIQERSNICEIAESYDTEGWWHIENGLDLPPSGWSKINVILDQPEGGRSTTHR